MTGPAVGSSKAMGHLPVEEMVGEEESVLRYRSVQVGRRMLGVRTGLLTVPSAVDVVTRPGVGRAGGVEGGEEGGGRGGGVILVG